MLPCSSCPSGGLGATSAVSTWNLSSLDPHRMKLFDVLALAYFGWGGLFYLHLPLGPAPPTCPAIRPSGGIIKVT